MLWSTSINYYCSDICVNRYKSLSNRLFFKQFWGFLKVQPFWVMASKQTWCTPHNVYTQKCADQQFEDFAQNLLIPNGLALLVCLFGFAFFFFINFSSCLFPSCCALQCCLYQKIPVFPLVIQFCGIHLVSLSMYHISGYSVILLPLATLHICSWNWC